MSSGRKPDQRWTELRSRGEQFTTREANELGLSSTVLSQAVKRGQIERVARGRYAFRADYRPATSTPKTRTPRPAPLVRLGLENFSVFRKVSFEFCPGINVLIGENGTGKSHAMLAAYSILRAFHKGDSVAGVGARIQEKLKGTFQPQDRRLGRLVRRVQGGGVAHVGVEGSGFSCEIRFTHKQSDDFTTDQVRRRPIGSSIFIPSREVLSMYEGFIGAYQQSHLSFSEVYYDTCVALNAPLARGVRKTDASSLLGPLLDALGGRVFEKNGRFYVTQGSAQLEAHLVSEGLRKIATVVHLINNGSLKKNDVLFWDEPEANLNPVLSKIVVNFLVELARQGVQVILATHDYSVTTRLSILAENGRMSSELIRFISLARRKGKTSEVVVSSADTLSDLSVNPILAEHEALYDFELYGGQSK